MKDRQRRRWFVVETKVQQEGKATESLRDKGYCVYAPYMRKTIIHHRTKQRLDRRFRLFARYLFVSLPHDYEPHVGAVRNCEGVSDILGMELDGKAAEVSREIVVGRFMRAQRRREFDDIIPFTRKEMRDKLPIGSRILVNKEHNFHGFHGLVTDIKGRGVVKAALAIFGRLVPVELRADDFQILKEA